MAFTYRIYVAYSYFSLDLLWRLKLINIFIYSAAYFILKKTLTIYVKSKLYVSEQWTII